MKRVMIVPGDGVGPEVVSATHKALTALTDELEFIRFDAGLKYFKEQGNSMSRALIDATRDCDAILLGTIMDSKERRYLNPETELRRFLGLSTSIHRIKNIVPGAGTGQLDTFLVTLNEIVNPFTEMEDVDGVTRHVRMQYHNARAVFETAAKVAGLHGRKDIVCVNYSEFYSMTSDRYRAVFHEVLDNSGLDLRDVNVEGFMTDIIKGKRDYGVIAVPLVYSRMVGTSLSSIIGGTHLTAISDYDSDIALFKPVHGPLPEIAGRDVVNPIGSMMSGSLMLRHFGMFDEASKLENAIETACRKGYMTEDLGGRSSRSEFVEHVLESLK